MIFFFWGGEWFSTFDILWIKKKKRITVFFTKQSYQYPYETFSYTKDKNVQNSISICMVSVRDTYEPPEKMSQSTQNL